MFERLKQRFFRSFFRLLMVAVAAGQWACAAWLLHAAGYELPTWINVAGTLTIYLFNRTITRRPRLPAAAWQRFVLRGYTSVAFAALFGAIFLLLNTALWSLLTLLGHGVSIAAGDGGAIAVLPSAAYEWTSTAGLLAIGFLFTYGYTAGQRRVAVTNLKVPMRRAARSLDGIRVAHITDIHLGQYMAPETLAGYVERVNALEPDLIMITGDILDALSAIPAGFPVLARLRARYGVFATLGNHDEYAGGDAVADGLRRLTPFTVLRNQLASVEINGARLCIAGVDDLGRDWARGVQFHPGLEELRPHLPADEPVILLSHRPDLFPQAIDLGIELVISGHTHGGQLALPRLRSRPLSLARFITPFDRGLFQENGSALYVNRGIGCTGQRIRLFATREIAVYELTAVGPAAPAA